MDSSRRLKVVLVNHSDTRGGASVVTRRLMDALCARGVDARMVVARKDSDSPRIAEASGRLRGRIPFLAEHLDIFARNGMRRDTLFKISTGRFGLPLHRHEWIREADIVVLNWVNQGMLSLREIGRIASEKPVVWTMHDIWNMTGVCHLGYGCERLSADGCADCPLTGRGSMARSVFRAKRQLYKDSDITFVAVSHAVAALCRQSPLMAGRDISVIPNAFPVDSFPITPTLSRRQAGLPEGRRLVVMGAARLDDPVKNLPLAVESLNRLSTDNVAAVFFGALRHPELLEGLRIPYVYLGRVDNRSVLPSVMAHADAVISTSRWETLPGTLVEGIAAGAVGVSSTNGGQSDIIENGVNGYLVDSYDAGDFAAAVDAALMLPQSADARKSRHASMAERFGAGSVAESYLRLFGRILEGCEN